MTASPGAYRYYVLILLLAVYCFSYVDRQIIAVVSPQLKAELGLSDSALGAIKGLAFSLFYTTMAVPLAILSDRWHRVKLITIALSLWSLMTALSSIAQSFVHLFLIRCAVGIGEAGGNPPSHSLISDYFRKNERATALGIFQMGVPLGTTISFLGGGWLVATLGWRATFIAVGMPGLLLAALLVLTLRERPRGASDDLPVSQVHGRWQDQVRLLLGMRSFVLVAIAGGLQAFCGYALMMWLLDFTIRSHGISLTDASLAMALVTGIGGGLGTLAGGITVDRLSRRDCGNYFLIPGLALIASAPLLLAGLWAQPTMGLYCLFAAFTLLFGCMGPFYGLVQMLAPANCRALAVAIFSLSLSILGAGLGPFLIGVLSDILQGVAGSNSGLKWALCVVPAAALAGGLLLAFNRRIVSGDLKPASHI